MGYRIENACEIEIRRVEDQGVLTISICEFRMKDVALGFCLLNEGLVAGIELVGKDMKSVRITSGDNAKFPEVKLSGEKSVVEIDPVRLDAWTIFTLRTIRDGVAEVDHLDLDVQRVDGGSEVTVILKFPSSAMPLSEAEIRRKIELQ